MKVDNIDFNVDYAKFTDKEKWIEHNLGFWQKEKHEEARVALSKIYDDCLKEYDKIKGKSKPA